MTAIRTVWFPIPGGLNEQLTALPTVRSLILRRDGRNVAGFSEELLYGHKEGEPSAKCAGAVRIGLDWRSSRSSTRLSRNPRPNAYETRGRKRAALLEDLFSIRACAALQCAAPFKDELSGSVASSFSGLAEKIRKEDCALRVAATSSAQKRAANNGKPWLDGRAPDIGF